MSRQTANRCDVAVAGRAADTEARILVQASVVADLDRRIAQIDSAVEKATDRGRAAVAMKLADEQRKARADLAGQRIKEAKTLADLKVEKAGIDGRRKVARRTWGRFATSPRSSASATRICCAGSFWSSRCCSIRPRCWLLLAASSARR